MALHNGYGTGAQRLLGTQAERLAPPRDLGLAAAEPGPGEAPGNGQRLTLIVPTVKIDWTSAASRREAARGEA